ncbi:MAG: site-2 protease family protein [Methanomassiliicoccaceae archaeon]|nr:site-2 protease family protein [Methanomassiliicoccaceae archaeon]
MRDAADGLRRVDPGYRPVRGKISFSKTEIIHIAAAIAVLSIAYSFVMMRREGLDFDSDQTTNTLIIIGISAILVICSFLFHELGHKFVAQRYNAWSEFRAYPYGLVMALIISSVFGFLFAAPGAVYIRGHIDRRMNGKISLAGPAVNFVIAAVAIVVFLALEPGPLAYVIFMLANLNAFLGLFNMIPVPPFDGSKIVAWNVPIYVAAALVGAAELAVVWLYLLL